MLFQLYIGRPLVPSTQSDATQLNSLIFRSITATILNTNLDLRSTDTLLDLIEYIFRFVSVISSSVEIT